MGEILRPFLMWINIIDVIIKRIGRLNMLTTPLGDIEIYIDDKKIEYGERNIRKPDKLCPDVDGRYSIEVNFCQMENPMLFLAELRIIFHLKKTE